jgi:class 3 adenylate cyclase/predicted ATPase
MFCDLVGSTALSTALDPEDLREVLRAFRDTASAAIERHGGYIARHFGDGMLVYFGYPRAHEDDAARAVRAGLEAAAEVAQVSTRAGHKLAVRVGIATGLVLLGGQVGEGASREEAAVGSTAHLAARLQSVAAEGAVIIAATTKRLVGGLFDCEELGLQSLKGFDAPVPAWRVLGTLAVHSRFRAASQGPLTPLVGRGQDLGKLLDCWQLVREGIGQAVAVSGDAGIGKSRLLIELRRRLRAEATIRLSLQCSPYFSNSALYPIIESYKRALELAPGEDAASKLDKIEATMKRFGRPLSDSQLIAALLSVPTRGRYPPRRLPASRQRQETVEVMVELLVAIARRHPTLLLVEDAHWADPSTLEMLAEVVARLPRCPVLMVITHRPEFEAGFLERDGVTHLALERLTAPQSAAIVARLAAGTALPAALRDRIVAQTDGVPLFVEELTRAVLEAPGWRNDGSRHADPGTPAAMPIPETLRDSLMARLDRSPTGKLVAQVGAAIGREFSSELLYAVTSLSKAETDDALAGLVDSGLLFARPAADVGAFVFKHALVQDVAYDSLLRRTRADLHLKIAQALEERFTETAEAHPELLAHHYTEAGLTRQAVAFWKLAGQRAAARSANLETEQHLRQAIRLLAAAPDGGHWQRDELDLLLSLAPVLVATKGYAAPEVQATYARALALCRELKDSSQLFNALRGLCQSQLLQAQYDAARKLTEDLLALADEEGNAAHRLAAEITLGVIDLFQGRFAEASERLQRCAGPLDRDARRAYALREGLDLGVVALAFWGRALWFLGYPDRALQCSQDALALAQDRVTSLSVAQAMGMMAVVQQARRDLPATREWVAKTIEYSTEQSNPYWAALAGILKGWLLAQQGQAEVAIQQIESSLADYEVTGSCLGKSWFLLLLAEARESGGHTEQALLALHQALTHVQRTGEAYYAAEIHRMRGELLLRSGQRLAGEAQACFEQALAVARSQHAKSFELRAASSLAQLWVAQSKHAPARQLLGPVLNWFTEGLDTADLQEARALMPTGPASAGQLPGVVH